MSEPFDVYADQFIVTTGPYGVSITFLLTPSKPSPPGTAPQSSELGVVRMSAEHLKVMVYILKRQIDDAEKQLGVLIPISYRILNELKVAPEDWEKFWHKAE